MLNNNSHKIFSRWSKHCGGKMKILTEFLTERLGSLVHIFKKAGWKKGASFRTWVGRLILFSANVVSWCICLHCESSEKQSAVVFSFAVTFARCPISNSSLYLFGNLHIKKKRYSAHMRRPLSKRKSDRLVNRLFCWVFFFFSLADGMIKNVQRQCFWLGTDKWNTRRSLHSCKNGWTPAPTPHDSRLWRRGSL